MRGRKKGSGKSKLCGVYMLRSEIFPDKFYIGSSGNIRKRVNVHFRKLKANISNHKSLQNHYNKYGEFDLHPFILKLCNQDNLIEWEQFYISELNPYFNEFKFASFPQVKKVDPYLIACKDITEEYSKNNGHWKSDEPCEYRSILTKRESEILKYCDRDLIPDTLRLN